VSSYRDILAIMILVGTHLIHILRSITTQIAKAKYGVNKQNLSYNNHHCCLL